MIERGELIRQARERGFRLTRERLSKWAREGLIGPARRVYGEGRGARSYYPPDTLARVEIIAGALALRRDFDAARLALWRAGYAVDVRPLFEAGLNEVRDFQARVLADREAVRRFAEDDAPEFTDNYRTLEELPEDWHKLPVLRAVRGALKAPGVDYADIVFLATVAHEPDGYHDAEDMSPGHGAILQSLAGLAGLSVEDAPLAVLSAVRPYLAADNLEELLSSMGDVELRRADKAFRIVVSIVNALVATYHFARREMAEPLIDLTEYPPKLVAWLSLVTYGFVRQNFGVRIDK